MDKEVSDMREGNYLDDSLVLLTLVITVVFFGVINEIVRHASKNYVTMKPTSDWRLRNLAISWVHANICAVGCIYCSYVYGKHLESLEELFDFRPLASYLLTAFSTGYFFYDFLDHIREGKAFILWEVTIHHIAVITMFGYNLYYHFCISFSVLALHVEINSVFLHGRKLLQMLHVPFSHWLYRATVALNLATFAVFRGLPLVLIWAGFLSNLHRCSTFYIISLGTVMVFMVILNPVLFWRLLRSDLFRSRRKGKEDSVEMTTKSQDNGKKDGGTLHEKESLNKKDQYLNNNKSSRNGVNVVHRSKAL